MVYWMGGMDTDRRTLLAMGLVLTCGGPASARLPASASGDRVFMPEAFGAKGDGVSDDSMAMAALSNAVTLYGGGTVVFRQTTYLVGNQGLQPGGKYMFPPNPLLMFKNCARPLSLLGNGARLQCRNGLRYGVFGANGTREDHPMPYLGDGLATSGGGAAAGSLASSGVNPGMSATAADSSAAAVAIAAAMQKGGTRAYVARGFVAPLPLGATPVSAGVGAGTSVAGLGVSYGGMGASLGTSVAVASARKALAQTVAAAHNTLRSPLRPAPGARTGGGTRTG
ncbi:hypothetical protein EON62_01535 [archaeon]|nr:MAG: hypothetical protein EON62_01535 [archaeon]